jgi:hypothetical protein
MTGFILRFGILMGGAILTGDVPSPIAPPPVCRFHTRYPYAKEVCMRQVPTLREVGKNHLAACLFVDEVEMAYPMLHAGCRPAASRTIRLPVSP